MLAIVETAVLRDPLDVIEQVSERVLTLPQLRLAKSGRVDDHAAARKLDQLSVARHVAAFTRAVHGARLHHLSTRHAVDQARLARARRTQQDARARRAQLFRERFDTLATDRARDQHRRAHRDALQLQSHLVG